MALVLYVGRELPTWDLWCLDAVGSPVDLTAYTLTIQVRQYGTDSTISGVALANASPTGSAAVGGVPSVNFAPAAGSLDNIVPGPATIIVIATSGGLDSEYQFPAVVRT